MTHPQGPGSPEDPENPPTGQQPAGHGGEHPTQEFPTPDQPTQQHPTPDQPTQQFAWPAGPTPPATPAGPPAGPSAAPPAVPPPAAPTAWDAPQPTQQLPAYGQGYGVQDPTVPGGYAPYGEYGPGQYGGYGAQPGYGTQPGSGGYGTQSGYGAPVPLGPPGYSPPLPPGYGPPGPPGYGPPATPPSGGNGRRIALIVGAVVAILAIAGVAFALASGGNDGKKTAATTPAPTAAASSSNAPSSFPSSPTEGSTPALPSDFPSGSASATSGVTETQGRDVVEQYITDINKQDENHAATLICADQVSNWRQSIHGKNGDFTVKVTDYTFVKSQPSSGGGLDLRYTLDVADLKSDRTGTSEITFTVVDENGAKICGES